MKMFHIHTILLIILCTLTFAPSREVSATEYDPGEGRLSGTFIAPGFYNETNPFNEPSISLYGSAKTKSPYTKSKYTHQSRFDGRTILHGIDVSKWQGEIDWNKVKADGIDYAFIQVGFRGYGSSGLLSDATKDSYFDINMQNAIAAGIKVGVYVFSQATTKAEAREEAAYILDAIGNYTISMPLVMDFEYASTSYGLGGRLYNAKLSKKEATNVCMAFCEEIAAAGYTPMVYANKSMLSDQLNAGTLTDAGYRIWLANYTTKTTYKGTYDFWQYSEKGSVAGIKGDVDMNFYYMQPEDDFTLAPDSISNATFSEVCDCIYTGSPITPELTLTIDGVALTPGVDYTMSYSNNTAVGTATIHITGIGKYCDSRNIRFDITPKTITSLKAKKRTNNSITLFWQKQASIKGYEIYRSTSINGVYKQIKTIKKRTTTSYKDTKLSAGTCYYYKIRSYKTVNGETYYSDFSPTQILYTKIDYTRNAVAKTTIPIYDYIPGTKIETVTVTEEVTTEAATEQTTETTTEQTTETTTEQSTETTTEQTTETTTEQSTETTTEQPTETTTEQTAETTTEQPIETTTEQPTETTTEQPTETTTEQPTETTTEQSTEATTNTTTVTKTLLVDSEELIQVSKSTKLKVIYSTKYKKNTWYYVNYTADGITYKGYVAGKNVTITRLGKVIKTKKVNVRKKATAYSKRLTTLKRNTKVTILSSKKKSGVTWYQVQFKKKNKTYKGWISSNYIKLL